MPLSIECFKKVAAGSQTLKERDEGQAVRLTDSQLAQLRQTYPCLDDQLFDQVVRVRKRHAKQVPQMLQALVDFRNEQGWDYRIQPQDLNPAVVGAHAVVVGDKHRLPLIQIKYGQVDPTVASAKDFQHECQYAIQEASQLHPDGEIAVECDFAGTSFCVLRRLHGDDLSRGMAIYQTFPVKVKQVYIINTTWPVRWVMKAVLALASKGIRQKVKYVHPPEDEPPQ